MFGKTMTVRPVARVAVCAPRTRSVVVRAEPDVSKAIKDAQDACKDDAKAKECANAWDDVEELAAAASHKQKPSSDPLEEYCASAPDADECRVYED